MTTGELSNTIKNEDPSFVIKGRLNKVRSSNFSDTKCIHNIFIETENGVYEKRFYGSPNDFHKYSPRQLYYDDRRDIPIIFSQRAEDKQLIQELNIEQDNYSVKISKEEIAELEKIKCSIVRGLSFSRKGLVLPPEASFWK